MSCADQYTPQLHALGFRMTPQRLAILHALHHAGGHLSPTEVYQRASSDLPGLTEPTVYRTLEFLADELTAINQYMVHSEMCADWGYDRLHEAVEKRAIDEMKHAEQLIGRIIFLEGTPVVSKLNKINIGASVDAQFKNDHEAERMAIPGYPGKFNLLASAGRRLFLCARQSTWLRVSPSPFINDSMDATRL